MCRNTSTLLRARGCLTWTHKAITATRYQTWRTVNFVTRSNSGNVYKKSEKVKFIVLLYFNYCSLHAHLFPLKWWVRSIYVALHQIQMWAQVLSQHKSEISSNNPNHKLIIKRSPTSLHNIKDKSSHTSNKPHLLTTFNTAQNQDTVAYCCNTLWWHHTNM